MMNISWKKTVAALLLCVYSLQVTTAVAMSSGTEISQITSSTTSNNTDQNTNNQPWIDQNISAMTANSGSSTANAASPLSLFPLSMTSDKLGLSGPLSFGTTYDTLLGAVFNGDYTQKLTDKAAISVLGEYGTDQYRINGTAGFQLYSQGMFKFGGEYLSQVLPFEFDSGTIDERVGQTAYGFDFQHNVNHQALRNINLGGYWAKAPNVSLDTLNFTGDDGYEYINQRNLAGATSQGLDFGGTLALTPMTSLDAALNYDDVYYHTELVANDSYNTSGMGGTLKVNQLIGDRMKVSAEASNRVIYNTYGINLAYAPPFAQVIGLKMAVFMQRLVSSNDTPTSNTYGLQLSFLGDAPTSSSNSNSNTHANNTLAETGKHDSISNMDNSMDNSDNINNTTDITQWVKTPAVYMDRVMITSEQVTTLAAGSISSIVPTSGPIQGGNTVTVYGTNFFPTTQVFFNGQPGTVTYISSHELSVIVPALVFTGMRAMDSSFTQAVDVTIDNPDGQSSTFENEYTYTQADATIVSISPSEGPIAGGTSVTITGTNFTGATAVTFGGVDATSFSVTDSEHITAVTPSTSSAETVDVVVTTPAGTGTGTGLYTYLVPPAVLSQVVAYPDDPDADPNHGPLTYTAVSNLQWLGSDISSYAAYQKASLPTVGESLTSPVEYLNWGRFASSTTAFTAAWGTVGYYSFMCSSTATTYNTNECTNALVIQSTI